MTRASRFVGAWAARAECDDAGDCVQRFLVDADSYERRAHPREQCVKGIEANDEQCAYWVERSAALATALAPQIGYARAAELSKQSVKENVLIRDLVKREHVLPRPRSTKCSI